MIEFFMGVSSLGADISLFQKAVRIPFDFNDSSLANADKYTAAPMIHAGTMCLNPFDLFCHGVSLLKWVIMGDIGIFLRASLSWFRGSHKARRLVKWDCQDSYIEWPVIPVNDRVNAS